MRRIPIRATPSRRSAAARSCRRSLAAVDPHVVRSLRDAATSTATSTSRWSTSRARISPSCCARAARARCRGRYRHRGGEHAGRTRTTCEVAIDGKDFHGIVHGDIKPKNIRIDTRGQVRVLDFGIAKALSLSRRLTRNEFGSVPYASPERLDRGDVDVHVGPLVAGGHAVRNGDGPAAVPGRHHRAAGAHDPLAHPAAAGAGPLPRAAAPHPDQGA